MACSRSMSLSHSWTVPCQCLYPILGMFPVSALIPILGMFPVPVFPPFLLLFLYFCPFSYPCLPCLRACPFDVIYNQIQEHFVIINATLRLLLLACKKQPHDLEFHPWFTKPPSLFKHHFLFLPITLFSFLIAKCLLHGRHDKWQRESGFLGAALNAVV